MTLFSEFVLIFFIGCFIGWVLELFYRHFDDPEKKWVNPGFCTGPWLPLYGFGACLMYSLSLIPMPVIAGIPWTAHIIRILVMGICATIVEYISGIFCIKVLHVLLWDYSMYKGNIHGIICPRFTVLWFLISAIYYFFIHGYIVGAIRWLSNNLAFSFIIGAVFGIFLVDVAHSAQIVTKMKQYAVENGVIVKFEAVKNQIASYYKEGKKRVSFLHPFKSDRTIAEHMDDIKIKFKAIKKSAK